MCKFKSGIIFKKRIVLAQGADNRHSELLKELGIEDSIENAITKFVRAELVPPRGEWWTDPDTWKFVVEQDIVPEWFDIDRKRYEDEFRAAVKDWCKEHVLKDQVIELVVVIAIIAILVALIAPNLIGYLGQAVWGTF